MQKYLNDNFLVPYDIHSKDIIIFIAGIVVAVILSYFFYRKSLAKKSISYSVISRSLVAKSKDYPSALQILYEGRPIEALGKTTVFVWNSGNQPITGADLKTRAPLSWKLLPGTRLLQSSVLYQTKESNGVTLNAPQIHFDYLNPHDGFILDVLVEKVSESSNLDKGSSDVQGKRFCVEGEVIGAVCPPSRQDYEFSSGRGASFFFLIFGAFLTGFMGLLTFEVIMSLWQSPTIWKVLGLLVAAVFFLLGIVIFIVGVTAWFGNSKMPTALLTRGEEPRTLWSKFIRAIR